MGNTKATSPLKIKDKRTKKSAAGGKEGDHRHRMTEQEEDEELLSDLNQAKKIAVSFDESPAYIKVGTMFQSGSCWSLWCGFEFRIRIQASK